MRRIQLPELQDMGWFPTSMRSYVTDSHRAMAERWNLFGPAAPTLVRGLLLSGQDTVLDLSAGSGGPWATLAPVVAEAVPNLQVTLADRTPNEPAMRGMSRLLPELMDYEPRPVKPWAVPEQLTGLRTQFGAFHGFPRGEAAGILADSVAAGAPVAIFEDEGPGLSAVARALLAPLRCWIVTPSIRDFQWKRILLTYLIPVIPLVLLWDGLAAALRMYGPEDLEELVAEADPEGRYAWEMGTLDSGRWRVAYLLGYPRGVTGELPVG